MIVAVLVIVAALALGFGAVQEFIVRGIQGGETQPALLGIASAAVSALMIYGSVAYARRKPHARRVGIIAAVASVVVHGYGALPPHVNVGRLALIVAVVSAIILLAAVIRPRGAPTVAR